jgi:pimeloyl-ACP methyl ester carboxylesterase
MVGGMTVPVDNGHLRYREAGTGPPVVLLHGGGLDLRSWDEQVGPLSAEHRVITPDARGHGGSSTPTAPYRLCDDVAALLRALDTGAVTLVGLSLGGGIAVDTALEHPELVSALVVSGTGTSEPDFEDPWMLALFTDLDAAEQAKDTAAWLDVFLRLASGPHRGLDEVDPAVVHRLRTMAAHTLTEHDSDDWVRPTPVTDTWARAARIGVPLLAVDGSLDADDHLRNSRRLVGTVPDGRAVTVEGTAHYPSMERPAEYTAILRGFLREIT